MTMKTKIRDHSLLTSRANRTNWGNIMRPYWLAAFACSLLTVCQVQAQDERSAYLIANSNRAGNPCGIAVLPEGGALAPALAKAGRFIVVSQEADDGAVRATCAATEKTGLLGRRLYICESPSNRIIVADKCANLIAYTRVTDATLGSFDPKYLLSKLSPYDGRAVVGLAKGAEGALTKAKLQAWAKGFGVPDVQIVEDEQGLWALVTRPALPNADEWTHTYHAEDNNPYSRDTALTWPFMTQWLGKPYRDGGAVHLVAGGRSFFVTEGDFSFGDRFTKLRDSNQIQARDLYNGELLWTYDIPRKYSADSRTSAYVATDKEFYLIDPTEDKAGVVVLDAQSGKQLRRLDCSTLGEQLKYLSMHRGKLYVMAGDKDVVAPAGSMWKFMNPFSVLNNRYKHDYGKYATTKISHLSLGDGRTIACLEPASGKVVWQHSEADNTIPEYQIGLTEGRLYYLAKGHAAVCLDAVTGRVIWANEAAPRRFGEYLQKDPQTWMMYHLGFCLAQSQAVLFLEPALGIIAVSPQDGRILWEIDVKRRFPVVRDGRVYVSGEQWSGRQNKDTHQVYDLLTGKGCDPDWSGDDRTPGSGCGGYNMSTNFLCSQMGVGYIFDARQRVGDYLGKKTNCVGATFVAGGLFLRPGHVCACDYTTHGYIAETSAADFDFNWKAGGKTQLRRAADYENVVPLSGDGWTCFRGSVAGANAVAVSVAPNAKVLWTAPPHTANPTPIPMTSRVATDFEPVQPVAAGDCVFTAGADGLIRCLDARDGAERWRFWTGGRIYASPAIWEGRLYTGSGDGYVYALEAATGRELWRFCAAPEERRLMAYGHLVSAWPVTTNILIHDGAAYLAACLLNSNGSHVYSLDAKTGDMRWHNGRSGLDDPENRIGVNTAGTLTVAQGKLWLRTNGYDHFTDVKMAAVDKQTVACQVTTDCGDSVALQSCLQGEGVFGESFGAFGEPLHFGEFAL